MKEEKYKLLLLEVVDALVDLGACDDAECTLCNKVLTRVRRELARLTTAEEEV